MQNQARHNIPNVINVALCGIDLIIIFVIPSFDVGAKCAVTYLVQLQIYPYTIDSQLLVITTSKETDFLAYQSKFSQYLRPPFAPSIAHRQLTPNAWRASRSPWARKLGVRRSSCPHIFSECLKQAACFVFATCFVCDYFFG